MCDRAILCSPVVTSKSTVVYLLPSMQPVETIALEGIKKNKLHTYVYVHNYIYMKIFTCTCTYLLSELYM